MCKKQGFKITSLATFSHIIRSLLRILNRILISFRCEISQALIDEFIPQPFRVPLFYSAVFLHFRLPYDNLRVVTASATQKRCFRDFS